MVFIACRWRVVYVGRMRDAGGVFTLMLHVDAGCTCFVHQLVYILVLCIQGGQVVCKLLCCVYVQDASSVLTTVLCVQAG